MVAYKLTIQAVNVPGVLVRITLILVRYGYNIESLVATKSRNNEQESKIVIEVTGSSETLPLTIKQIDKLIDVVKISSSNL
ncbi:MAG: ACT domain-containing protein [Gammaproteobacteria bacterium]|nr:ACT domain-containing protein [Gammaproteobacteria bacterium]